MEETSGKGSTPPSPASPPTLELTNQFDAGRWATRLLQAITKLTEVASSTQLQTTVLRYRSAVHPSKRRELDASFPIRFTRHPLNHERSTSHIHEGLVLFHLGNVIMAWYDCLRGGSPSVLEQRLIRLENIASDPSAFYVEGSDAEGFHLVHNAPALSDGG